MGRKEGKVEKRKRCRLRLRGKQLVETAEGPENLVNGAENPRKLAKRPSGEMARMLFPWAGSVQLHLVETSEDTCPISQVCQSW